MKCKENKQEHPELPKLLGEEIDTSTKEPI